MFKPLLAPQQDPLKYPRYFEELQYPLLCSPKYDGIRGIVKRNTVYSRTFIPLPSYQVQDEFCIYQDFDGEIIDGSAIDYGVYNRTQSKVMSREKPGDYTFFVFDYTSPDFIKVPYEYRLEELRKIFKLYDNDPKVVIVDHVWVTCYDELIAYEERCLSQGFEGIMMRDPSAYYKQGRGTFKEGIIYKLKRFQDDEGLLVGLKERLTNENPLGKSELGYAKRSTHKDGMIPAGTTGKFVVDWKGVTLDVAPGGFTHDDLQQIWDNQDEFLMKIYIKFRYFGHGIKDKPRFPRAVGFRSKEDI